jgi:hypothetical protein
MKHASNWSLFTFLLFTTAAHGQDAVTYLPPPFADEPPPPAYYYSLSFGLVQPRLHGSNGGLSPTLDWTVSPRFEAGLLNRGPWNPYVGYQLVYSEHDEQSFDPFTETTIGFGRSTELHAIDLGVKSEPFHFLSVLRAQWDLSARLTVFDFRDRLDADFAQQSFVSARVRQQFVGAGPRGGLALELPLADSGWSIAGQADGGVQWGSYRSHVRVDTFDGEFADQEVHRESKGGVLWHAGAQLGLRYAWPACDPRLIYSMGYMYEIWFSKELGFLDAADRGYFQYHGPFFNFQWRF